MIRVLVGHVLDRLAELPAESVHCVMTSPPYYGLRDYGIEPQVWGGGPGCEHEWGDEATAYRSPFGADLLNPAGGSMGKKKREGERVSQGAFCRRCNAWLGSLGLEPTPTLYIEHMVTVFREVRRVMRPDATAWVNLGDSYANKQLQMIPAKFAQALQVDGWWLRSEITWAKRTPMPESCTDRPTTATEKVFLLTRSARYFYDAEAVNGKRNMRNWWLLGPEPFPEAHFATFPTEVPRRAILAGTSERGVCPKCGAGWERIVERAPPRGSWHNHDGDRIAGHSQKKNANYMHGDNFRNNYEGPQTIGWRPTCSCDATLPEEPGCSDPAGCEWPGGCANPCRIPARGEVRPATVLDPFLGAGTTALVADRLGRHCIGIELSPKYAAMAERRCREEVPLFAEIAAE